MRTPSRRTSNRHKRILATAFVAIMLIVFGLLVPRLISLVAVTIMYPVHATNTWIEESGDFIPTLIRDKQTLEEKIKQLENDLIVAGGTSLTQQRLAEENNRLRQLFSVNDEQRIAATVIARPDELPYDLLQIDRGSRHGVVVGAPVFVGRDIVIGLVVNSGVDFSFVQLVSTPGFEATAFVTGANITATIEGLGGGQSRVRVPQGIPLTVGNLVYLPSIEPGVFGRIIYIENQPTQPEQFGYVSNEIPLSSLHYVAVGMQSQVTKSVSEVNESILEYTKKALMVDDLLAVPQASSSSSSDPIDNLNENEL